MCHHASIRTLGKSGTIPSSSGRNSSVDGELDLPKRSGLVDFPEAHHPDTSTPARVGALLFEETGECFSTQGL